MGKGDIGDQGNDAAELFKEAALSKRAPEGPKPRGYCLTCGEEFAPDDDVRRWCDRDCRNYYEQAIKNEKMKGSLYDPDEG